MKKILLSLAVVGALSFLATPANARHCRSFGMGYYGRPGYYSAYSYPSYGYRSFYRPHYRYYHHGHGHYGHGHRGIHIRGRHFGFGYRY